MEATQIKFQEEKDAAAEEWRNMKGSLDVATKGVGGETRLQEIEIEGFVYYLKKQSRQGDVNKT